MRLSTGLAAIYLIPWFVFFSIGSLAHGNSANHPFDETYFRELFSSPVTSPNWIRPNKHEGITAIHHCPGSDCFAIYDDGGIHLRSLQGAAELGAFSGQRLILALDFAPDGKLLVSGGEDHTLRTWNVESQTEERKIEDFTRFYYDVKVLPSGTSFLAAGSDKIGGPIFLPCLKRLFLIRLTCCSFAI